jgi:2-keto-3-deoxy-L-rhamnonate aldolase RhmA
MNVTERLATLFPKTRLFQRLAEARPAFGSYTFSSAREIVEMLGDAGLDYVVVDMMVSPTSWETAANLASVAYQFEMTPWIRIQSYPWSNRVPDSHASADVLRALSIGFQVVQVSVDGAQQAELALDPRLNDHRRIHLASFDALAHSAEHDTPAVEALIDARSIVIPSIESERGLEAFAEIVALPGLRLVKFGMGDLLQVLGHKGEIDHPGVRGLVEQSVAEANQHGVGVVVNMPGKYTAEAVAETAAWLWEAGVQVIEIPYFTTIVNRFYADSLERLRIIGTT